MPKPKEHNHNYNVPEIQYLRESLRVILSVFQPSDKQDGAIIEIENIIGEYQIVINQKINSLLKQTHTSAIKKTRKETIRECVGIVDNWKRGITNHNPNDLIKRLNNLKKYNE